MTTAFYRTGTVAVTQNSKVVTGTGTNWTTGPTKPLAGDVFIFNNKMYEIDSVVSDTEIRLYRNFEDSTASSKSYAIMRNASLNISARIAAQVAQVVNQKQIMIDEFHDFLTNNTDSTVPLTDTLGNTINVTPIPMLDKDYVEKIGGIDAAVNQAIQDINDKFDSYEYILMREAEARAIQWQNENVNFDASGFVHTGKQWSSAQSKLINEGMMAVTTDASYANTILLGRYATSLTGTSKTDYPVIHLAGAVANVLRIDRSGASNFIGGNFLLPEAEDGTRIYNSTGDARGSGKASLDLKVDIDPKYGDVPTGTEDEILREAVGRAGEGMVRNGDFRLGSTYWSPETQWAVEDGALVFVSSDASKTEANARMYQLSVGQVLRVTYTAKDVVGNVAFGIYAEGDTTGGVAEYQNTDGTYTEEFEVLDPSDFVLKFRASGTVGASFKITSVSAVVITEEVVTHPVDLVALEYYEEELTGRQEIFECIQSLSTTFGTTSVPTVLSTRKLSYFQQYDGQFLEVTADPDYINDRYRCVVWDDLTEPQKREVAAYMGEKLFVGVNGHIVNGRLRARTFRGSGNGDWVAINPSIDPYAPRMGGNEVTPQGSQDTSNRINSNQYYYSAQTPPENLAPEGFNGGSGIYQIRPSSGGVCAYKGRCFLYVLATVPRLNSGCYHPSFNPFGSASWRSAEQQYWPCGWANLNGKTKLSGEPTSQADCFTAVKGTTSSNGGYGNIGNAPYDGNPNYTRPDGIFYDGIEAGGLNGVIDWRLGAVANDSPEEAAKVEAKVENSTYRGLEKLVWTTPIDTGFDSTSSDSSTSIYYTYTGRVRVFLSPEGFNINIGDKIRIYDSTLNLVSDAGKVTALVSGSYIDIGSDALGTTPGAHAGNVVYLMHEKETNLSVSGEFNTQMVIADPVNFLEVFPNGILGTWCPAIPDGANKTFDFSRKDLEVSYLRTYTNDNGVTWATAGRAGSWDSVENAMVNEAIPLDRVEIHSYKAFAKQTKPSENKPVYNGKAGLMDVIGLVNCRPANGAVLCESVLGKVITNSVTSSKVTINTLPLTQKTITDAGLLYGDGSDNSLGINTHAPLTLSAPNNNSPAVKVLPYQISNNGQGSIGYQANELTWDADATNWGDDSAIKVTAEGSDAFIDKNGITNLSVVHELAIPYTWTSNHARAGEQVEGVDL